jgi:hypothetical protein
VRAEVIRLACERPAESEVPLARWSSAELAREAVTRGICEQISGVTVWRWLSEDAIKPWQHRSWIFPRDPDFTTKAGRILDLYAGRWEGELLHPGDYVVCCDEKPSIQARHRKHRTLPATARVKRGQRVEHEYERKGALCYLAAWDARRAKLFDRCAPKDGIAPFDALVEQFMSTEPYSKAQRVFVIADNGSAHRGKASINRLQSRYKNLILVHTPVHASWLNQAEIYFSIVQRKVLTPNDFPDLDTLEQQLLAFGHRYQQITTPFEWKFTRDHLDHLAHRIDQSTARAWIHRVGAWWVVIGGVGGSCGSLGWFGACLRWLGRDHWCVGVAFLAWRDTRAGRVLRLAVGGGCRGGFRWPRAVLVCAVGSRRTPLARASGRGGEACIAEQCA